MNVLKKFFGGLLIIFTFSFNVVGHAEEIAPYFTWKIKNYNGYAQSNMAIYGIDIDKVNDATHDEAKNKLLAYDINIGDIDGTRDKLYDMIIKGDYYNAAILCEMITVYQKILFGSDFFDESLTELTAKLYLITDELDIAERKIKFLSDNAQDNLTKIRALNLKSDLLNRRGNYFEALQVTDEVAALLENTPDENLSLINQARIAQAYCGLTQTQKSMNLAEKILPKLQNDFGTADMETLALMSTVAENHLRTQHNNDALKILLKKFQVARDKYGTNNLIILSKIIMELASYYFEIGDSTRGEEFLNSVLIFVTQSVDKENNHDAFQMYKTLNETSTKYLDNKNVIVLKSELVLAQMNNIVGNIPQSIELCKKNLPNFKKVFGEKGDETLALMKILSDDYLLLGKYADAKKFVGARLTICKNNFGEHDVRTIAGMIDLANICYRTGKYKTADNLLNSVNVPQNKDIFKDNPEIIYYQWFNEYFGERMKGGNILNYVDSYKACIELEEKGFLNISDTITLDLETLRLFSILGGASDIADIKLGLINLAKIILSEHHPKILEMMSAITESYVEYGKFKDAERYANQILKLSRTHLGENNICEWRALITLSKIRRAEGNFNDALKLDSQALQIAEKVCGKNSLERMHSLDAIASDHATAGNFVEAIKIRERTLAEYKKILEDNDEITFKMMTNLAENYVAAKRYADAIKLCDDTLALQKVPVYSGEQISIYAGIADLFRIKATAQKLLGDNTNAYENYKKLIQIYEGKRIVSVKTSSSPESKSKWFVGIIPVYRDAAFVAASDKVDDTTFAFYCTEFCKGRNLIDRFDDIIATKDYLLNVHEKNILTEYENLLSSAQDVYEYAVAINDDTLRLNSEIIYVTLRFSNELFKGELREKYSGNMIPKDSQEQSNIWSWEAVIKNFDVKKNQAAIPDGACLVEFMKTSDDSLLVTFLRNEGDVQAVNIPVDKKFFDDCQLYHELNSYPDIKTLNYGGKFLWKINGEYKLTTNREKTSPDEIFKNDDTNFNDLRQEISSELSAKLIPTLEKFAGSSSHWIISPDAELNLVPFETLKYHDKLLVESKDVSYVPSLAVMNLMRNRERKNSYLGRKKELFAMGNAIYSSDSPTEPRGSQLRFKFGDLPGTAQELDKVSPLFDSKTIFRREQATEKNLRAMNSSGELSKYKYMLFAAHGVFVPEKPEYSSIVLSQQFNDEDNDGYVTVGEWMGYDLRSNLIYLSACESGRGGYQAGEGIVGIPYALTVAGNKDTVMSLWKVNDAVTAEFTSAVFEKLSRGQSEVSALNETKREFLKQENPLYKNPSVWAAFLLYGI